MTEPTPDTPESTYPCIWCGTPLIECDGPDKPCCESSDHPYPTIAATLTALHDDVDEARLAIPESEMTGDGLRAFRRLVEQGPQWSPHPDIRAAVPDDPEWGKALVAVADLRAILAALPNREAAPDAAIGVCARCGHGLTDHPAGPCRSFNYPMNCHCPMFLRSQDVANREAAPREGLDVAADGHVHDTIRHTHNGRTHDHALSDDEWAAVQERRLGR